MPNTCRSAGWTRRRRGNTVVAMYACSCRAVRERTVRAAIAAGAWSIEQIGARCGAGTVCGGCHPILDELLATAVRVRTTTAA